MEKTQEDILFNFRKDKELQEMYIKDKNKFLNNHVLNKEYVVELKDIESKLLAEYHETVDNLVLKSQMSLMSNTDISLLVKSKNYIRLETTYGYLSVVTGYYIILSEQATKDLINGIIVGGAIVTLIAALDPELISKATATIIAAAIALEIAIIKLMDAGNGVYFYINPFLLTTIPVIGPAALIGAWVGPLRN